MEAQETQDKEKLIQYLSSIMTRWLDVDSVEPYPRTDYQYFCSLILLVNSMIDCQCINGYFLTSTGRQSVRSLLMMHDGRRGVNNPGCNLRHAIQFVCLTSRSISGHFLPSSFRLFIQSKILTKKRLFANGCCNFQRWPFGHALRFFAALRTVNQFCLQLNISSVIFSGRVFLVQFLKFVLKKSFWRKILMAHSEVLFYKFSINHS